MTSVQRDYRRYPDLGRIGDLVRPTEPHAFDLGLAHVPTNGRKPRPGDSVYYDTNANGFAVPTSDAQRLIVCGIVSFDPGVVQGRLSAAPSGANSDQFVEFDDEDPIKVTVFGTVWVMAGAAMEYGQQIVQDSYTSPDWLYDPIAAPTTVAAIHSTAIFCVSPSPVAANGLAQARIGYGRIR